MTNINKTFTYKVPDDYTLQTADNDSSATFTYHGPKYLAMEVNPDYTISGVNKVELADWEQMRINDETSAKGLYLLSADANPLEAAILWEMRDSDMMTAHTIKTTTGPDGASQDIAWPLPPHKAYEPKKIKFNTSTQEFVKPHPWHENWITWEAISIQAENEKNHAIAKIAELEASDSDHTDLIASWNAFKTEAENKVSSWTAAGFRAHQVSWNQRPDYVEPVAPPESDSSGAPAA